MVENWKSTTIDKSFRTLMSDLRNLFRDFDSVYNSKLFEEHYCEKLIIDNNVLEEIILVLYKYNFDLIDADVLGSIYEDYIGHILEEKGAKLDLVEDYTTRKKSGIYYTPTCIVEYIVRNIIERILGESPTLNDISNLKVIDPACGSGSFLIKAFDVIKKYYDEYNSSIVQKARADPSLTPFNEIVPNVEKKIIKENIYGVDLDPQAAEISTVNLMLKALKKREKLPLILGENIKYGNSLVDDPNYENGTFIWEKEFGKIMKLGGFDVVIGNPPYYSVHFLDDAMKDFLATHYCDIHTGQNDIFYYFYYKGIGILRENGFLGFITARYFLESRDATKLREWIIKNCKIITIVDFGNIDMFGGLGTRTAVVILEKLTGGSINCEKRESNIIQVSKVKCRIWMKSKRELIKLIEQHLNPQDLYEDANIKTFNVKQSDLTSDTWILVSDHEKALKRKIESKSVPLEELCFCGKGMETGLNEVRKNSERFGVFHLTTEEVDKREIEPELLEKLIKNSDIDRYLIDYKDLYLLYLTDHHKISKFPKTEAHLSQFKEHLLQRYGFDSKDRNWYAMSVPRNKELFDNAKEKLVCPYISPENRFAYDNCTEKQKFYSMTDTTIIAPKEDNYIDLKFILAVLNSTLSNFYYRTYAKPKDYRYEYFSQTISKMCIPDPNKMGKDFKSIHDNLVKLASEMLELRSQQNIIRKSFTKVIIDNLVDSTCRFKDYFENALSYSFKKSVLLKQDVDVQSCVIQLSQKKNTIFVNAYFDDEWHKILKMTFEDLYMRDFIYISIDNFIRQKETAVAWRKGKIIRDVILCIKIPRIVMNHEENKKRIHIIMTEIKSTKGNSNIGGISERIRDLDKLINETVYRLYEIDENERKLIENSIDYRRPYLRY